MDSFPLTFSPCFIPEDFISRAFRKGRIPQNSVVYESAVSSELTPLLAPDSNLSSSVTYTASLSLFRSISSNDRILINALENEGYPFHNYDLSPEELQPTPEHCEAILRLIPSNTSLPTYTASFDLDYEQTIAPEPEGDLVEERPNESASSLHRRREIALNERYRTRLSNSTMKVTRGLPPDIILHCLEKFGIVEEEEEEESVLSVPPPFAALSRGRGRGLIRRGVGSRRPGSKRLIVNSLSEDSRRLVSEYRLHVNVSDSDSSLLLRFFRGDDLIFEISLLTSSLTPSRFNLIPDDIWVTVFQFLSFCDIKFSCRWISRYFSELFDSFPVRLDLILRLHPEFEIPENRILPSLESVVKEVGISYAIISESCSSGRVEEQRVRELVSRKPKLRSRLMGRPPRGPMALNPSRPPPSEERILTAGFPVPVWARHALLLTVWAIQTTSKEFELGGYLRASVERRMRSASVTEFELTVSFTPSSPFGNSLPADFDVRDRASGFDVKYSQNSTFANFLPSLRRYLSPLSYLPQQDLLFIASALPKMTTPSFSGTIARKNDNEFVITSHTSSDYSRTESKEFFCSRTGQSLGTEEIETQKGPPPPRPGYDPVGPRRWSHQSYHREIPVVEIHTLNPVVSYARELVKSQDLAYPSLGGRREVVAKKYSGKTFVPYAGGFGRGPVPPPFYRGTPSGFGRGPPRPPTRSRGPPPSTRGPPTNATGSRGPAPM